MATSTSQGSKTVAASPSNKQTSGDVLASVVRYYIMQTPHFPNLNHVAKSQYDIVAVILGIFQMESGFTVSIAAGASSHSGSTGKSVQADIKGKYGKPLNLGNPNEALVYRGLGIGQCMGWYLIKNTTECNAHHGKGQYAALSNSLGLLVSYGQNPMASMSDTSPFPGGYGPGDTKGLRASVVASMVILEEKLRALKSPSKTIDKWVFDSVGAYLGKGRDAFGTTPAAYTAAVRQYASRFKDGKGQVVLASAGSAGYAGGTAQGSAAATKDTKEWTHCPQA